MRGLPEIVVSQIPDPYGRENFRKISEFLSSQFLFLDFRPFTKTFAAAETHAKFAHNLGFLPKDVIVTSKIGAGAVTFNQDLTTDTELDITVTGPCEIRFIAGTFNEGK